MIEFSGRLWVLNWHLSNFLCHCFDFLHGPWSFRTCYQTKILSKCECKFRWHYNIGSSTIPDWIAKVQNQLGLKWKILLKSQSTQNFSDIKACGSVKTRRRENAKFIVCKVYNYLYTNIRSSHSEVFFQRGVLKSLAKFTEKHLWQIFFLI